MMLAERRAIDAKGVTLHYPLWSVMLPLSRRSAVFAFLSALGVWDVEEGGWYAAGAWSWPWRSRLARAGVLRASVRSALRGSYL